METAKFPFTDEWMGKQNVAYLYNGILLRNKKDWSTFIGYNIDEVWKHYSKWKKSVKKTIYRIIPFI